MIENVVCDFVIFLCIAIKKNLLRDYYLRALSLVQQEITHFHYRDDKISYYFNFRVIVHLIYFFSLKELTIS